MSDETKQMLLAARILELLMPLSPEDRAGTLAKIRFNDVFCASCGYGSYENPNPNCQCENDE